MEHTKPSMKDSHDQIAAIEKAIKEKYGIDLHDPTFMHDIDKKAKFKQILTTEYPHLMYST